MSDRDGNRSNPYHPRPDRCCNACVFGEGRHATWCLKYNPIGNLRSFPTELDRTVAALSKLSIHGESD